MIEVVISGTGVFTPAESISNEELVASFNQYVEAFNKTHADAIRRGEVEALRPSDEAFIFKASGIKSRYVVNKSGILDVNVMQPMVPARDNDELSLQAEMAVISAQEALARAHCEAKDIDMVICACSTMQRPYPGMAMEVQAALGMGGYAFDMSVACSSATFGIQTAVDAIRNHSASTVLIVTPEICTANINFRDRDSHFIFGDASTAIILQRKELCRSAQAFTIVDTCLKTQFSNNIRSNFGFLAKMDPRVSKNPQHLFDPDQTFIQQGRKVFKEVIPLVSDMILHHLAQNNINTSEIKRLWLHQANINMNRLIASKVLGYEPSETQAPNVLEHYANTSSPGCIIAFHFFQDNLHSGDIGVICSFGAGYSAGNVIVKKI